MPQKTHYADDLFVLSTLVKGLESSLAVEADPEYFRERIAGDIFFIDSSIRTFAELLAQNAHLIERAEYVKLLARSAKSFIDILGRLLSGALPESAAYAAYAPQFRANLEGQKKLESELEALFASSLEGGAETDLVSQDELSELLRGQ
jgi:hypothetical protein